MVGFAGRFCRFSHVPRGDREVWPMRRYTLALSLAAGLFILFASGTGTQAGRVSGLPVAQAASGPPVRYGVQVSSAARHDVSPPLRDLHGAPATSHVYPTRPIPVLGSSG